MALHRLSRITLGVPDVDVSGGFYTELGLTPTGDGGFATTDGGEQLRLEPAPIRRLLAIDLGCDDGDDLDRFAAQVAGLDLGVAQRREGDLLELVDPATAVTVRVRPEPPLVLEPRVQQPYNSPGAYERLDARAEGILREEPVRPRKLSHVVLGSPDVSVSQRIFTEGLGFKVSDEIAGVGAFLRCSTEHHNLLVQAAPVPFMHHSSWQVDDVDEIGRGASAMLATDPDRHVWGLGRHYLGSNFFWYLRDPAGNFAEYSSDIDVIVDDELWEPGVWSDMRALMAWGPSVPASFIAPDDLADLMAHGAPST